MNLTQEIGKKIVSLTKEKLNGEWHNLIIDITNICNLRCPFCCNDWSQKEQRILMKKETFDKIIEIMPLIQSHIYLSCLYEPTLHPQFAEFINMIPSPFRKKCFFTTNLTTNISDATLEEFSHSGIKYINISLDSFNPNVYKNFRKGARFEHFISNLNRLVSIFAKNPNAPSIRYITMVFKQNVEEIPSILEKCKELYLSSENEFRSSFNLSANNWPEQNKISNDDWKKLVDKLNKGKYSYTINRYDKIMDNVLNKIASKFYLHSSRISIDATGLVKINNRNIHTKIENIPNPFVFFKRN